MSTILLLEPDKAMQAALVEALSEYGSVMAQSTAASAVARAHDTKCDVVVMELSLGGHSGFEFLYEFRTYTDWEHVPIIVYTTLQLDDRVLRSRVWEKLKIAAYLYKPQTTLASLRLKVGEVLRR